MNMNVNNSPQPVGLPQTAPQTAPKAAAQTEAKPQIDSTLEKIGGAIYDNTKDGTFIGDNMLLTGAGALVGTVAAGSAVKKTADAIPAVNQALKTVFVDNGKLVGGAAALGAAALLAEDAVAAYKEGQTGRAAAEGAGAALVGLGGTELIGRQLNVPVMNRALSGPAEAAAKFAQNHGLGVVGGAAVAGGAYLAKEGVQDIQDGEHLTGAAKLAGAGAAALGGAELIGHNYNVGALKGVLSTPAKHVANFAVKNAGGLGGTAVAGAGVALGMSGLNDLEEGETMLGGAKLAGAALAGLGGVELVGRNYDIPVARKALSGTAEWVSGNVKAVTGATAVAGGAYALVDGVKRLNSEDGNKWLAGAEIAGGVVGTLGGAELIGRNFNIPGLNQALTGPVKYVFTSKAGITGAGGLISASGLGLAGDGVRRLTTEKGILNDAIGVAEVTGGVAAVTGGASVIGYATGSEKLMRVFPENIDVLGGVALAAGGAAMAKYTADSMKEEGLTLVNTATATGSAAMVTGGAHIVANKFGLEAANGVFEKGYQTIAAAGLGAAAYKLGEMAVNEGAKFVSDTDDLAAGGKALGLGTAAAASGTAAVGLVGHAYNVPVLENTARKAFEKGWQPVAAVGLGAATYKLGEMAVEQGQKFMDGPNLSNGAAAVGLATAGVLTGAGTTALVGKTFGVSALENAGMGVLNKVGSGVHTSARYVGKGAEAVFKTAVKHPFATLGVLAAAGAGGYYLYNQNKAEEAAAPQQQPVQQPEPVGAAQE